MLLSDQQMQVSEAKTQGDIATRPPVPPFTSETAIQKVRMAEDGWNSRDAVSLRMHQRSPYQGIGQKISLASWAPSRCASRIKRSRLIAIQKKTRSTHTEENNMPRNGSTKTAELR